MPDIYLTRLRALRAFGIPLAEQKEAEGHLEFGYFMSACGTYGCLLGWWATTEYARNDGWRVNHRNALWNSVDDGEEYFGISLKEWRNLFETDPNNTLTMRKAFLDELIQRRTPHV